MADKTKGRGGGKLARSQTVTVRLDPKLRYLAELGARKQRRTVSSFIEWAIEESLQKVALNDTTADPATTIADEAERLWDIDEADRFIALAILYPSLLTHDEQEMWKMFRENELIWRTRAPRGHITSDNLDAHINWPKFRSVWNAYHDFMNK